MIDFLKQVEISDENLKLLYKQYSSNDLISLNSNSKECLKIIEFFKMIGISNIEELLINEMYVFCKLSNEIVSKFRRYNITTLVEAINNDYTIIESVI